MHTIRARRLPEVYYQLKFDDACKNSSGIREKIRDNSIQEVMPRIFFLRVPSRLTKYWIAEGWREKYRGTSSQVEISRMNVGTQTALVGIQNHSSYFPIFIPEGEIFIPSRQLRQFMLTKFVHTPELYIDRLICISIECLVKKTFYSST